MRTCEIDGCDKPHKARGWCRMHWNRWSRHGDPHARRAPAPPEPCEVDGCDRDGQRRGLCWGHYTRVRRFGDVVADVPLDPGGTSMREVTGTRNPEPDVEACVDCGGEADGGMIRCWPCAAADLAERTSRKPFGDSKARPSEDRVGVRRVRTPDFTRGAA